MNRATFSDLSYESDGVWHDNDQFTGTAYETWPDGTLHSEQDFLWGHKDGKGREWNRAGRLIDETSFKEGVADGPSRGWHDNGRLAYEHTSESGVILSSKRWDETGTLVEEQIIDPRSPDLARVLKFREDAAARAAKRTTPPVWREVRYDYGNEHDPVSPVGRFIIELSHDGYVHTTHLLHASRRDWRAKQEPSLWPSVIAALAKAGFPHRPDVPAALTPGTSSFTVAARSTYGQDASVTLPTGIGFEGYNELSLLMMTVIGQTDPDILGFELPDGPRLITDVVSS